MNKLPATHRIPLLATAALLAVLCSAAVAEVITDGTLGAASSLAGPNYDITSALGQQRGANLFHSFSFFNIGTGESANFSGPAPGAPAISNIISRVTGGSASTIDGAINSSIPGANLYLINPGGVIFGDNASLNIGGSFHASTASYLVLADGVHFDAVAPASPVLSSAPPTAFGFLDGPAGITATGSLLRVAPGETLTLAGGDITTSDTLLYAPGGTVQLASVASAGEVGVDVATLDVNGYGQMGNIDVSHPGGATAHFVSGVGFVGNLDASGSDAGTVVIRSGQFVIDTGLVFADSQAGSSGAVDIRATGLVHATNGATISADHFGTGAGGTVNVVADRVLLENGGRLQADNYSDNAGGGITVQAADSVTIAGRSDSSIPLVGDQASGLFAAAFGAGDGGDVAVASTTLDVGSGGVIELNADTAGGSGGALTVTAQAVDLHDEGAIRVDTLGSGDAGSVTMTVDQLDISGGANISTKSLGSGDAGSISITAADRVTVSGSGSSGPSGIYSNAFSIGNGGQIQVASADLNVDNGARIQAGVGVSPNVAGLPPATATTRAGNIDLQVERLQVSGTAQISTQSDNAGQAGDITVRFSETLHVSSPAGTLQSGIYSTASGSGGGGSIDLGGQSLVMDGGAINVSSASSGDAGTITAAVESVSMRAGGQISTSVAGTGSGGVLQLAAGGSVNISGQASDGFRSGLYSSTAGSGGGGAIDVSAANVSLVNNATINSESTGSGDAGSVTVAAVSTVQLDNASINTSAANADGGNVKVTATDLVYLRDSQITAAVGGGLGNGGNVTIDPEFVVLSGSRLLASAIGGNGGNITIVADHFISSADSVLNASSQLGIDGSINILSPDEEISSNLVELPVAYLDAAGLLRERCSARHAAARSSFVVAGRDSLPVDPGSPYSLLSSLDDATAGAGRLAAYPSPAQPFLGAILAASSFGCSL